MTYDLSSCINEIKSVINKKKSMFFKIDISCKNPLKHGCILGQGSFGTVCYVEPKRCNPPIDDLNPLALKYMNFSKHIQPGDKNIKLVLDKLKNMLHQEVKILNSLKTVDNVLKIYPIIQHTHEYIHTFDTANFCIATQYLNGKNLYNYIIDKYYTNSFDYTNDTIFKNELDYIAQQLILTLKQIHDKQILHLDIKPENILLDNSTIPPTPVFIDFGLAKERITHSMKQTQGTPRYMPDVPNTTRFNDIYALGITLVDLYNLLEFHDDSFYVKVSYPIINDLDEDLFIDSFNNINIKTSQTIENYDNLVEKIEPIKSRPNPDTEVNTSAMVSTVKKSRVGNFLYYVFHRFKFNSKLTPKNGTPNVVEHTAEHEEEDVKGGKRKKSRRIVKPSIKRRVSRRKKRITRRKRY